MVKIPDELLVQFPDNYSIPLLHKCINNVFKKYKKDDFKLYVLCNAHETINIIKSKHCAEWLIRLIVKYIGTFINNLPNKTKKCDEAVQIYVNEYKKSVQRMKNDPVPFDIIEKFAIKRTFNTTAMYTAYIRALINVTESGKFDIDTLRNEAYVKKMIQKIQSNSVKIRVPRALRAMFEDIGEPTMPRKYEDDQLDTRIKEYNDRELEGPYAPFSKFIEIREQLKKNRFKSKRKYIDWIILCMLTYIPPLRMLPICMMKVISYPLKSPEQKCKTDNCNYLSVADSKIYIYIDKKPKFRSFEICKELNDVMKERIQQENTGNWVIPKSVNPNIPYCIDVFRQHLYRIFGGVKIGGQQIRRIFIIDYHDKMTERESSRAAYIMGHTPGTQIENYLRPLPKNTISAL
jgi:hypothetical protein